MNDRKPEWIQYREKVIEGLVKRLQSLGVNSAEKYIDACFWIFSSVLQDLGKKITKNQDYYGIFYPALYQLQDVVRANLGCQQNFVACSSAFNLRVAFEIYCNVRYILKSTEPSKLARMYDRYQEVEKFLHKEQFSELKVSDKERARLEQAFPEWFLENGKRRKSPIHHWTAIDRMNLGKVAREVGMGHEYSVFYGATSKFTHGSQLVWNFFRNNEGQVTPIPDPKVPTMFTITSTAFAIKTLVEFCEHFGVKFPAEDYAAVSPYLVEAQKFVDA